MKPRSLAKKLTFYYDKDWLTWDPDVMEATLSQKFGDDLTEKKIETIEATREVIRSDRFAHIPLLFENCVRAFNGVPFSFDVWQPVTEEQMGYGLEVMRRLVGTPPISDEGMGERVRGYIATILARAPIAYAPAHFGFHPAAESLRRLMGSNPQEARQLREGVKAEWKRAIGSSPTTPRQLYRHIKSRFLSGGEMIDDLSPPKQAQMRHVTRLATVWEKLFDKGVDPSSINANTYDSPEMEDGSTEPTA